MYYVGINGREVSVRRNWNAFLKIQCEKRRSCRTYEDLERFLFENGRLDVPNGIRKPRPRKRLYIGYSKDDDDGRPLFDFMFWAETKAQVIEHLRNGKQPHFWWQALRSEFVDQEDWNTMHVFEVLRLLDYTDGRFGIEEVSKIADIRPKRYRRRARDILKHINIPKDLLETVVHYVA